MTKLLFLVKNRSSYSYGRFGLWNSATFIVKDPFISANYDAKLMAVIDADCIDRVVTELRPRVVFLEAIWVTPDKLRELVKLHPSVEWVVRVHSVASFLAQEGIAFSWMSQYQNIPQVTLSTNNLEFNIDLQKLGHSTEYLPNLYRPKVVEQRNVVRSNTVNICCMGALRPLKNHVAQAIAAIQFAESINKTLTFHINENSDGGNDSIMKSLEAVFEGSGHNLVSHKWLEHSDFVKLLATMDLAMQVSFSESFCIVAADSVAIGIPTVVSTEIKFVSSLFRARNTTASMVGAMRRAYYGDSLNLQYFSKRLLDKHNEDSVLVWKEFLKVYN